MVRPAGSSLALLMVLWSVSPVPMCLAQTLVPRFEAVIGSQGNGQGQLNYPGGVAIDPAGNVYVADSGNSRVQLFDRTGRFLRQIGGFGFGAGQFGRPQDIVATGLDVFVTDPQNRNVQRFDRGLNLVATLPSVGRDSGNVGTDLFARPWGIAVSGLGDLYITDSDSDEIVRLSSSGDVVARFGGFGDGTGRLRQPTGIVVDASGRVYVADSGNGRIAVFDAFGGFLDAYGEGELRGPRGLCIDSSRRLIVADTENDRIAVFAVTGELLLTHGVAGDGTGSFSNPLSVAVNGNGSIYVADTDNSRIQVFTLSDTILDVLE